MIVPGANLLTMAHGLIGRQAVSCRPFLGLTANAAGNKVPSYGATVELYGSFQPVSASMLQQLGLDWSKNYATFYCERVFNEPERDKTGDLLTYNGKTYRVESRTPWFAQDGWESVLCVEVTNA